MGVCVQSVRYMALGDTRGPVGRRHLTTSALAVDDDVELNAAASWDDGDDEVIKAQHDATGSDEFSVRALCLPAVSAAFARPTLSLERRKRTTHPSEMV